MPHRLPSAPPLLHSPRRHCAGSLSSGFAFRPADGPALQPRPADRCTVLLPPAPHSPPDRRGCWPAAVFVRRPTAEPALRSLFVGRCTGSRPRAYRHLLAVGPELPIDRPNGVERLCLPLLD